VSVKQNLREQLERIFEIEENIANVSEIFDRLSKKDLSKKEEFENAVNESVKRLIRLRHPLFRGTKLVNWPNIARERRDYLKLKAGELLKKFKDEMQQREDLEEIMQVARRYREGFVNDMISKAGDPEKALRPYHAPGSLSISEARNLYFGEKYGVDELLKMFQQLSDSICIGDSVAVYFEGGEAHRILKRYLGMHVREHIDGDLLQRELRIGRFESGKPYIVLVAFLLWLYDRFSRAGEYEERDMLRRILEELKIAAGLLYFVPGLDRAEYSTTALPSLHHFLSNWVENESRRRNLEALLGEVFHFSKDVLVAAMRRNERKRAEAELKLLAHNLEIFCKSLLETGALDRLALRRLVDIVVDLSLRYETPANLKFCRPWT